MSGVTSPKVKVSGKIEALKQSTLVNWPSSEVPELLGVYLTS